MADHGRLDDEEWGPGATGATSDRWESTSVVELVEDAPSVLSWRLDHGVAQSDNKRKETKEFIPWSPQRREKDELDPKCEAGEFTVHRVTDQALCGRGRGR